MQVRKLKKVQQRKMKRYVSDAFWTRYIDRALSIALPGEMWDISEMLTFDFETVTFPMIPCKFQTID